MYDDGMMNTSGLLESIPSIPLFDVEAALRHAASRHEQAKAAVAVPGRFIGTSLTSWLDLVQSAGVPVVPAQEIASMPRDVLLRVEDQQPGDQEHWSELAAALKGVPAGHMARWELCSGLALKMAMAAAEPPSHEVMTDLDAMDPRAFGIFYEFPADVVKVVSRPWVRAGMCEGYPVEFRVFVKNNKVLGVANYYPQRPLPLTYGNTALAHRCLVKAENIVDKLVSRGAYPWMPSYERQFDPQKVSATLDFIATPDGGLVFLEAGPPFGAGAHPCAFIDREISGVALELAPGARLR